MSKPYDATLNALIDAHADEWAAFLDARIGLPAGPITSIDTDLSITHQADRLFRIDSPEPAVLHLELESSGRLGIPTELLRYNVAAHGATGLPVASVVVLLRPKATATDLTGTLELRLASGPYLTFHYTVLRLWLEPMEALLAAGVGLAPLAMLTNEAAANLNSAFERFHDRLKQPSVSEDVRDKLLGATYVLGGLRYTEERFLELYMSLHNILEDSTTYQGLMRRGQARGRQDMVLELGRERFGPTTAATEAAIRSITDLEKLQRMAKRILHAADWNELLAAD